MTRDTPVVNDHRLVREGGWVYKRKHLTQMAAEDGIVMMTTRSTAEIRREKPKGVRDETHEKPE